MAAAPAITLDDLIALNDEIVALSRAGVPLQRGLVALGQELPGKSGQIADELGRRLEAGESLETALDSLGEGTLPASYLAVVRAGIRAGRLPIALEGISTAARRAVHLRRTVGLAMVYPTVVFALAYILFLLAIVNWVPVIAGFYEDVGIEAPIYLDWLGGLGRSVAIWGPFPPLLLLAAFGVWWWRVGSMTVASRGGHPSRRTSGLAGLLLAGRMAGFAEVLALLVEQHVPLDEALVLAGDSSGNKALADGCRELAEQLRRGGHSVATSGRQATEGSSSAAGDAQNQKHLPPGVPPILCWMVLNSHGPTELATSLRRAAETYRARVRELGEWMSVYLPMLLTAALGGTAGGCYVLIIFLPWAHVLTVLSVISL